MIRVREAGLDDMAALVFLGERMRTESTTAFPEIDRERVREYLSIPATGFILVAIAEDDGEPIGMITAVMGPHAFSYEKQAVVDLLFVTPEKRGSSAALRLMRHFLDWAAMYGVAYLSAGQTTGVDPERTGRFFTHMGFRHVGSVYKREI